MHFLQEITIIATVSVLVTIGLGRLKLPVIAGLVLSGALVGPNGLVAQDSRAIEVIAEVGVVFLLFTIGLEFSYPSYAISFDKSRSQEVSLTGKCNHDHHHGCSSLDGMVSRRINHLRLRFCLIEHRSRFTHPQRKERTGCPSWAIHRGNFIFSGSLHRSHGFDHTHPFTGAE